MKRFILFLAIFAFKVHAEPTKTLEKALQNKELSEAERKELVQLVIQDSDQFIAILKKGLSGDLQKKGETILEEISTPATEDEGKNRLGSAVGWFTKFKGEELTSYPILSLVHKGSPAAKGKLKLGDVIVKAEGVSLDGAESRNRFVNLLKVWPTASPLALDLLRNNKQPELDERVLRTTKTKAVVTLEKN